MSDDFEIVPVEVDRISHGKSNSHIETHVSRTSREQAIEDLREAEELTNE